MNILKTIFGSRNDRVLRRMRKVIDNKKPKMTMTVSRVRELANESGFDLVAAPHLSRVFSGHRYALLVRR